MKIVHVSEGNFGGVITIYDFLLRKNGIESEYLIATLGGGYYQEFGEKKYQGDIHNLLKSADILHVHGGLVYAHSMYQYEIQNRLETKPHTLVMTYHGVGLRYEYTQTIIDFHKKYPMITPSVTTPDLLKFLPTEEFGTVWINHPIYHSIGEYVPIPENLKPAGKVCICHSTSSNYYDQSDVFHLTIRKLQKKYPFVESVFLTGKKREYVLNAKRMSHINFGRVSDKYGNCWYNMGNLEAMSMGLPSLNEMDESIYNVIGYDCPIVNVSRETVYEVLEMLVQNFQERKSIGEASREWVIKNHEPSITLGKLLECYRRCN